MTGAPHPTATHVWWARPSRVLPVVASIILLIALLTPQRSEGRLGDSRLTTNLPGSLNARTLADLSQRLGWRVVRDTLPEVIAHNGRAIHAVLATPIPLSPVDAHKLLQAVRQGDALLLTLEERDALTDSLGVAQISRGYVLPESNERAEGCPSGMDLTPSLWANGTVQLAPVRWLRGAPAGMISFANLKKPDSEGVPLIDEGTAAVGFPYGKGRVVVVSDPDLLRNDVIRKCRWGVDVIAVRMLEWLRAGGTEPRSLLIFDEYHQGYGDHGSVMAAMLAFLVDHPVGRTVLVVLLAGLLLLAAMAPRPIVPPLVEHVERRDPLEHVDALSHAYEQVHATRTIVARLVRGVRWRVQRVGPTLRASSDAGFLDDSVARYPQLQAEVQLIKDALERPLNERELPAIGAALHRVEDTLTRTTS